MSFGPRRRLLELSLLYLTACTAAPAARPVDPAPPPPPSHRCTAALHKTRSLRDEGRLDRAARVIERALPSCSAGEREGASELRREVLKALGREDGVPARGTVPLGSLREADAALARGDAAAALAAYAPGR